MEIRSICAEPSHAVQHFRASLAAKLTRQTAKFTPENREMARKKIMEGLQRNAERGYREPLTEGHTVNTAPQSNHINKLIEQLSISLAPQEAEHSHIELAGRVSVQG